jgi:hypothetical protein
MIFIMTVAVAVAGPPSVQLGLHRVSMGAHRLRPRHPLHRPNPRRAESQPL